VLVASIAVLVLLHAFRRPIVEPMIPVFRAAVRLLATEFIINSAEIVREGPKETLRFRANLSMPLKFAGQTLYPFGWRGVVPQGGYQVRVDLGGVLQYCALLLILVLAWPASHVKEFAIRLALSLPLTAILLLIDVPSTVAAELWGVLHREYDPGGFNGWMVWSRFLMGGGGLVIACLMGTLAIAAAASPHAAAVRRTPDTSSSATQRSM